MAGDPYRGKGAPRFASETTISVTLDMVMGGTAGDLLQWVGTSPRRAEEALLQEMQRPKPRQAVVMRLEEIASGS